MSFSFLRGFNLIAKDTDSLHLEIEEMKLPGFEEKAFDFTPGGGTQEMDVPLGVTGKLELPFKLATQNPGIIALYGLPPGKRTSFTARKYVVDEEKGKEIEVTVDIKARLMKLEAEQMKGGEKSGFDHTLSAVTWYQEVHEGKIMREMNFFAGGWTMHNGKPINKTRNRMLGIS